MNKITVDFTADVLGYHPLHGELIPVKSAETVIDFLSKRIEKLRTENEQLIRIAEDSFKHKAHTKQAQKAWHDLQVIKKHKGGE